MDLGEEVGLLVRVQRNVGVRHHLREFGVAGQVAVAVRVEVLPDRRSRVAAPCPEVRGDLAVGAGHVEAVQLDLPQRGVDAHLVQVRDDGFAHGLVAIAPKLHLEPVFIPGLRQQLTRLFGIVFVGRHLLVAAEFRGVAGAVDGGCRAADQGCGDLLAVDGMGHGAADLDVGQRPVRFGKPPGIEDQETDAPVGTRQVLDLRHVAEVLGHVARHVVDPVDAARDQFRLLGPFVGQRTDDDGPDGGIALRAAIVVVREAFEHEFVARFEGRDLVGPKPHRPARRRVHVDGAIGPVCAGFADRHPDRHVLQGQRILLLEMEPDLVGLQHLGAVEPDLDPRAGQALRLPGGHRVVGVGDVLGGHFGAVVEQDALAQRDVQRHRIDLRVIGRQRGRVAAVGGIDREKRLVDQFRDDDVLALRREIVVEVDDVLGEGDTHGVVRLVRKGRARQQRGRSNQTGRNKPGPISYHCYPPEAARCSRVSLVRLRKG